MPRPTGKRASVKTRKAAKKRMREARGIASYRRLMDACTYAKLSMLRFGEQVARVEKVGEIFNAATATANSAQK